MKAQPDNSISTYEVEGDFPDGEALTHIASKESLYVIKEATSEVMLKELIQLFQVWTETVSGVKSG